MADLFWKLRVDKIPTDELTLTNCAIVNGRSINTAEYKHVSVTNTSGETFILNLASSEKIDPGKLGLNVLQRRWTKLTIGEDITIKKYPRSQDDSARNDYIYTVTFEVDFMQKKSVTNQPYNTDEMTKVFIPEFFDHYFTVQEEIVFQFKDGKLLKLRVKEMSVLLVSKTSGGIPESKKAELGRLYGNSIVAFQKSPDSQIVLTGKAKGGGSHQSIINPDWDFNKMGIGGLDSEFSAIFRRAFSSRVFPPELIEELGTKHARGILLFGPPGTGKTLMARQIGKMLNAREPKIISGPQILNKYVGESESNIRQLFADAEEEEKSMGINSGLHIIIFDEIDAICKARGSVSGNTGVHDTVVNQLLAKLDGVDQLNNILLIGMTNRKDMIDDALLRPGRLEVHMEIGLPDEPGRLQILKIHTSKMTENDKLDRTVDLTELAKLTKNFSGAEIEGLVRSASTIALNRHIKGATSKVEVDSDAAKNLKVTQQDFYNSLENDIKPAFGTSLDEVNNLIPNGIIQWGDPVTRVLEEGELLISQTKFSGHSPLVTVLLEGPPSSGKTALAAQIAKRSDFPFLKVCSPEAMIGYHESAKCQAIKRIFDDAHKSPLSCILLDSVERLLDYVPIGPRFSNLVLQALIVLLNKIPPQGRRLLVLATTTRMDALKELDLLNTFSTIIHVSNLSQAEHVVPVINELGFLSESDVEKFRRRNAEKTVWVGIKKLLMLIERVRQVQESERLMKFQCVLEEEAGLPM